MNEPKQSIFDLARTVTALEVAEVYAGVKPKGGRRVKVCCPIHPEKTPSCVFYENGTFYCFGCHAGGSSIDFVMALYRMKHIEAAEKICHDFGLNTAEPPDGKELERRRQLKDMREAAKRAASFTYATQCGVIHWCDDRLSELDPESDSEEQEALLELLLQLRTEAEQLTDAITALENTEKENNLYALLRKVQDLSTARYHMLKTWDETQGTRYVKEVQP